MKKLKQLFCKHDYIFMPNKLAGLPTRLIRGVCKKCGKNIELSTKEYKVFQEKTQEDSNK